MKTAVTHEHINMVVSILPAVNPEWLIYSKPVMHIEASQSGYSR